MATRKNNDLTIKKSKRGEFTAKAKERGLTAQQFANKVVKNPGYYSESTRKQAQYAKNIGGAARRRARNK